jgi:asparagine synthase (glutamine-hydrolysing)
MCGISAIYDPKGHPVETRQMQKMVDSLHHRGPDDHGVFTSDGIGLGSTRLSILDLSPAGHMPMLDPQTGNQIIHNGEIYNHLELVKELSLRPVKSQTDTEVILAAYEKFGEECVQFFNGIFAFVIWDARQKKLFCARDRIGVKPLLYTTHNNRLYLASEAKALFAAGVPKTMNNAVVHEYLTRGIYDHGTATFFDGINQLAPAHTMSIDAKGTEVKKYWDLNIADGPQSIDPKLMQQSDAEIAENFGDLVTDAIKLQLRTDTPLAVHVSGGLDSMLLMSIINQLNNGQGKFKALSQIYGEAEYDEKPYVDALAEKLGWEVEYHQLNHHEVPEITDEAMWQQEQPFPGMVTLAKQMLMKKSIGHGAKVILEGQGGDEIAGGYQYYFGPFISDLQENGQNELAASELKGFASRNNMDQSAVLALAKNGIQAYEHPGRSADGTLSVNRECIDNDFLTQNEVRSIFSEPFSSKLLNMQYRDIFHTKLPRILRSCDRASMGNSRELRVPLLDHRLVEFSFHMPATAKIRDGEQRLFMRNALRKRLAPELSDAPKRPVVDPQKNWLKGPLKTWVEDIIHSRSFAERGLFDAGKVIQTYDNFITSKSTQNSFPIWQWVSMELWARKFLDA